MRGRVSAVLALAGLIFTGVPATAAPPSVGLLADTNRDGAVNWADQAGKGRWTPQRGAIFLPNLDDDARRCKVSENDMEDPAIAVDVRLAACNDAQDNVVNGARDVADFAPLRTVARSGSDQGTVALGEGQGRYARLWVERDGAWVSLGEGGALTGKELRAGARLAVEGRDVIRDKTVWDGVVTVTLKIGDYRDAVQLRVAPLILQTDLKPPRKVVTSQPDGPEPGYEEFLADLKKAMAAAKLPSGALSTAVHEDRWFQDIFEPTTASMPGPGGRPQVMHVLLRSANYYPASVGPGGEQYPEELRHAGRVAFSALRGPDVGVVQQYTEKRAPAVDDSLNSTGNFESLPPYRGYELGRPLYGSTATRQPDASFTRLIDSQYAAPVVIDTSWLLVGHSDETLHAIPARNARGWTLMVADPRLAVDVLRQAKKDGHGSAVLFDGTSVKNKPTVDQALADASFLEDNAQAARHIDDQLAVLTRETGLAASELVRVPVLFNEYRHDELSEANDIVASGRISRHALDNLRERMKAGQAPRRIYAALTAGVPNGISLGKGVFGAPDPHGPRVNGVDLFKRATERALAGSPVTVSWIEDWDFVHEGLGEVHCATNALREPTKADWWR